LDEVFRFNNMTAPAPTKPRCHRLLAVLGLILLAAVLISCGSTDPTANRILLSVAITPPIADAQNFPNGQVVFTATGSFSLQPSPALVPSTTPYSAQFTVSNSATNQVVATIVSSGSGTATVQCVAGMSGTVTVADTASANNGIATTVSGIAQITCP
jgi:hypothetical protein